MTQLLDYLASKPNATIRFHASKMILNVHSDASYLSEPNAKSRVAGRYFLGEVPSNGQPIMTNGNIFVMCGILKFVVCSAAEAELAALFLNTKAEKSLDLFSKNLATHSRQLQSTVITKQQQASPTTLSKSQIALNGNTILLDNRPGQTQVFWYSMPPLAIKLSCLLY